MNPGPTRTTVTRRIAADPTSTALLLAAQALPPQRTPTSYVIRFDWAGPDLPATTAELTLGYAPDSDGTLATQATLVLASEHLDLGGLDEAVLQEMAVGFLAELGRAAELRSHAA